MEALYPELCTADSNIMDRRQMLILSALVFTEKENKYNNKSLKIHLKQ